MRKNIIFILSFLSLTFITSSCLKDDLGEDWTDALKGKMYAQIVNNGLRSYTINNGAADQTISIFVNIATDSPPGSNVTLTFAIDPGAVDAYNAADTTRSFVTCPNISLPSTTLVIEAGTRNGYIDVTLKNADLLDLNTQYIVPVSIVAADNGVIIASNFKTTLIQVPVANRWEGSYLMSGYALRAGDPVLTGNFSDVAWKLGTNGAKSVVFYKTQCWGDGKSTVGGIGPWTLTVDDSGGDNNPMPVVVTDPANAAVTNNPDYFSRYEPSTKTFYISVYWGNGPLHRAACDTLVYSGPY